MSRTFVAVLLTFSLGRFIGRHVDRRIRRPLSGRQMVAKELAIELLSEFAIELILASIAAVLS